jgi:hypothetical protein
MAFAGMMVNICQPPSSNALKRVGFGPLVARGTDSLGNVLNPKT